MPIKLISAGILVMAVLTFYVSFVTSEPKDEINQTLSKARLGMNLTEINDWSTEYPFVDMFLNSREWISNCKNVDFGKGPKLERDANGWVKKLEPNCFAETLILTNNKGHAPFGDYTCLYQGKGEINIKDAEIIPPFQDGHIVANVSNKDSTFIQLLKTDTDDPIHDIHLIIPGYENTYKTQPFYPPFLEHWKKFDTFRFMDWMKTNDSKIKSWDQRPTPGYCNYTEKGVPVEVMVQLCNQLKINPWFCMPHLADNDYIKQMAILVKKSLDPTLKIYIEYSNEVWNNMFEQQHYAEAKAKELGLGPKERPWEGAGMFYGERSQQIFKIWEEVFGGRDQLVRVIAWQAASDASWTDGIVLGHNNTGKNTDALAIAPYMVFNVGPATDPNVDTVSKWTVDQVLDYVETTALPQSIKWIETQKKVADNYGIKLICYEAGQHLVGVLGGENNDDLTKLFLAANRHPRMGKIYTQYMDAWDDNGGDLMCIFSSTSQWSKWGSWGLTEYMDETEETQPKFKAVMEWNSQHLK